MIKVIIVDDSAIVRKVLSREIGKAPDIAIVANAPDPFAARDEILRHRPDVMTLDIEMPRMDGLTFLRKIMKYYPIPTIIVSSLTPKGSEMALDAFGIGAVEVMAKPGVSYTVGDIGDILIGKIRMASKIDIEKMIVSRTISQKNYPRLSLKTTTNKIMAIGASTGGTVAIENILRRFPKNAPGIVLVQHMPAGFTASFAKRLDSVCEINVKEAQNGDSIVSGTALLAPGNYHTTIKRSGTRYYVEVKNGPRVFHQRPSVDVLFHSAAKYAGANCVGIILTGMGADGAMGLLAMRESGAQTIAQDERTSVVWGMPGEAVKKGAAEKIVPLMNIPDEALKMIQSVMFTT